MRKSTRSIVLGTGALCALGLLAASAAAQPGQTPATPVTPVTPPGPGAPPGPAEPPPEYGPQPEGQPMPPPPQQQPAVTRATFVSTGDMRWDVQLDNQAVCTTPCALALDRLRYVTMQSQERASTRLAVGYLPVGEVVVQAKPRAQGAFAAGVTFTTLSGMGLVTGIALTAVGCATDRDGMCKAGLITGGASALGLYLSIDLLRRSLPRVYVGPGRAAPYVGGNTVGLAGKF